MTVSCLRRQDVPLTMAVAPVDELHRTEEMKDTMTEPAFKAPESPFGLERPWYKKVVQSPVEEQRQRVSTTTLLFSSSISHSFLSSRDFSSARTLFETVVHPIDSDPPPPGPKFDRADLSGPSRLKTDRAPSSRHSPCVPHGRPSPAGPPWS